MMIYICSQMRGFPPYTKTKYSKNLKKTAEYCKEVAEKGFIPIAPHLFFTGFLDEQNPKGRADRMRMSKELMQKCDEIWVFGAEDGISEGMKEEIKFAGNNGIYVRYV